MKASLVFKKIGNEIVTVELKNGIILNGLVIKIDSYMNLYLKHVKRSIKGKNSTLIPTISIRGTKIRYIILPNWINFDHLLGENP